MALTDTNIKAIKAGKTQKKHSDSGGLYLLVKPSGSKLWQMAYRFGGKQKTLSFGPYPIVSLADARRKRDDTKRLLVSGVDPYQQNRLEKQERDTNNTNTFDGIADELLAKTKKEGKADTTINKKTWLLSLARPDLGKRVISEITAREILNCLRKVEDKGNYETARRLRAIIGQVFRYAIATSRADNDPTFGLKGALISPTVTHRAAVTEKEKFGGLLRSIWEYDGTPETKAALKLMAILYPRPGELRQAEWSEFDLEKATWTIPATRAKMRREHRKPLPKTAIKILNEVKELTGDGVRVFPAIHSRLRPMSENTLNSALRRMGYAKDEMTSHGFRATASTLLNESGKWSPDAIEAELAHVGADEVRNAYHRALYWDERVKMAEWWSAEIELLMNKSPMENEI